MMRDTGIAANSLAEGAMMGVTLGGDDILLTRIGGHCHAVGNICPHAGARLSDGVLRGGIVTCPWHKAAFDAASGRLAEPPAFDDLPRYTASVEDGRVFIGPAQAPAPPDGPADTRCVVVIGAGAAGAAAVRELRAGGFTGRITMIGDEGRLPYDRTVLSKYVFSGASFGEKTPLLGQDFYARHDVTCLTGRVDSVTAAPRRITLSDGRVLTYDAALLATGGTPRPLDVPGAALPGVFLLRGAADAGAIAAALGGAQRAVIAGAGFIAMEAAASLRQRGLAVTVVSAEAEPLARVLGPEIGAILRRVHERAGVTFRLGTQIAAVEGERRVSAVRLSDGGRLGADIVLAGMGISPNTGMLRGAPLGADGGARVDARLRVADALYAAGDIAAFPLYGDGPVTRVEHWRLAQQQGRAAARIMRGGDAPFRAVPYFWTTHFMQRLDYVGHAESWDELIIEGDTDAPKFLAFYLQGGAVAAIAGWGMDRAMTAALVLMGERRPWRLDALRHEMRPYIGA